MTSTVSTSGSTTFAAPRAGGAQAALDTLPATAAGLDQPDVTYRTLTSAHVATLRAAGTPEQLIAQLAEAAPTPAALDARIQAEIFQNPEGWDAALRNPPGTARAGLLQLAPGMHLPAPGQGSPGSRPDWDDPSSGFALPGLEQSMSASGLLHPMGTQTAVARGGPNEGIIKGAVITAAIVGVGLLAWRLFKGKGADAKSLTAGLDAARGVRQAGPVAAAGLIGGGAALTPAMHDAGRAITDAAAKAGNVPELLVGAKVSALAGLHPDGALAGLEAMQRGVPISDSLFAPLGNTALAYNQDFGSLTRAKLTELAIRANPEHATAALEHFLVNDAVLRGFQPVERAAAAWPQQAQALLGAQGVQPGASGQLFRLFPA